MTQAVDAPRADAAPAVPVIAARGVSVRIGPALILVDVSVEAHAGEVLALVGPNGAGKTTLLHVLAGDVQPAGGDVLMAGRPLRAFGRAEAARFRGVLPQHVTIAFPFTVEEVVRMGRAPWRSTAERALDDVAVAAALRDAGVLHLAAREVTSLSGGERARVAFARLLAQQPTLMLLDEPTAALDIHHQELLLQTVRSRIDGGGCAVVVMHDLGLAAAYADRLALLSDGAVAAIGMPADVLRPELVSEVYRHDVDVIPHPRTGTPIVVPARDEHVQT